MGASTALAVRTFPVTPFRREDACVCVRACVNEQVSRTHGLEPPEEGTDAREHGLLKLEGYLEEFNVNQNLGDLNLVGQTDPRVTPSDGDLTVLTHLCRREGTGPKDCTIVNKGDGTSPRDYLHRCPTLWCP